METGKIEYSPDFKSAPMDTKNLTRAQILEIGKDKMDIDTLRATVTRLEGERDALKAENEKYALDNEELVSVNVGFANENKRLRAELDRARDDGKVFYENMKAAEKRASDYKAALELIAEELQDCKHKEGKHSPAPVSQEAEKCVWERIGRSTEEGGHEVIWRGTCGQEEDVAVADSLCRNCLRPIQLAEGK